MRQIIVPTTTLAKLIEFAILCNATPNEQRNCQICGRDVSLHRPDIDEDLSIAGLMAGAERYAGELVRPLESTI